MRIQLTATSLLVPALTLLAGCSQSYNGAIGLGGAEQAEIAEYQEAKRTPIASTKTTESAQLHKTRTTIAPPIPSPTPIQAVTLPEDAAVFGPPVAQTLNVETPQTEQVVAEPAPNQPQMTPKPAPAATQAVFTPAGRSEVSNNTAQANPTSDPRRTGLHRFGELDDLQIATVSPLDNQGNLRRVTFTHEGADFDVEVDPTGRWLAYASTRHRHTSDIYLQRVDGTAVTQLTTDPANDVMPCISPDGKQIAFASDRAGTWDIYLMDMDGGPAIKLTEDGAQNIHPSFSPDGTQLVYSSRGSQSGVWELILIDVNRPNHRKIIGHGLFPVWSPNGNKIVYQRARERGSRWFSIWTVEITADGEAIRPTEIAASSNAAIITPEWSPDGRNIVFCTVLDPTADSPAGSRADIWISNADGSGRARLTHGNYGNLYPTWAADGSIYFVSNRGVGAIENVYAVKPDQAVYLARQRERQPADTQEATVPTAP
ncbi:MAG: DPP IV N-terminal domain-containing protein [Planctomycetota bacterium]